MGIPNRHPRPLSAVATPLVLTGLCACTPMGQKPNVQPKAAKGAALAQCEALVAGFRRDQTLLESAALQAKGALDGAVKTAEGALGGENMELPASWAPNRSRPLCAYPTVATYKGSGSLEGAANFACR